MKKKWIALVLCFGLMMTMLPPPAEAAAVYDYSLLNCRSWGANLAYADYMNKAMRFYIENNSSLRSSLNSGNTLVFAFEGGSAKASPKYNDPKRAIRTAALLLVVKLVNGQPQVVFSNDESNTFPDMPTEYSNNCVAGGTYFSTFWCFQNGYGPGTMKDGMYSYSKYYPYKEHYALKIASSGTHSVYINPKSSSSTGYVDRSDVTGLYVHYRLTGVVDTSANQRRYSMGCVNVGQTVDSSKGKDVDTFVSYCSSNGYFVLDRQLYLDEMTEIYSNNGYKHAKDILNCITAWSSSCAKGMGSLGDVDGNGCINLADVSLLYRMSSGQASASAAGRFQRGDMNKDGSITLKDVAELFNRCR